MAQLPDVFKNTEPSEMDFSVIPNGWQTAQVVKSELKNTKAGDGQLINFMFKIIDGKYAKRMIFENMNIINKNITAMQIAKANFNKLCVAASLDPDEVEDTQDLHGIDIQIKLGFKPASGAYPEGNKITDYRSADNEIEEDDETPF